MFLPDGRFVAVSSGRRLRPPLGSGDARAVGNLLKGFLLSANSVAFSPDGHRMAVGSSGVEAVKLWDSETRQEVRAGPSAAQARALTG